MSTNFKELLSQQVDDIEPPKLFPAGVYEALITEHKFDNSTQKGTPYCRFMCKLIQPVGEFDREAFEEAGGLEKLNGRSPLRYDFYLTDDAFFRLKNFMKNGLNMETSARTFDELMPETKNSTFLAVIKHSTGREAGSVFMEISGYATDEPDTE